MGKRGPRRNKTRARRAQRMRNQFEIEDPFENPEGETWSDIYFATLLLFALSMKFIIAAGVVVYAIWWIFFA